MKNNETVSAVAEMHGFDLLESQNLTEIDGIGHILSHKATGARLIFLENDDNNKSFSIAFKTPPKDSTGVFHILEHSVLCGSKRYPVKEPFVNLLKSSMQTFLNAMTFPDKTVYPVASTSEQDLENLMNVYLDAVFNPQIYDKREIFEQEGWHFETTQDAKLDFSGVVYNEMKGALSSPDAVMMDELCTRLYPETAYAQESGGLPSKIPTLTYEDFLDEHTRHYHPSNSYITLYGNLDIARFLKIINEDYLSQFESKNKQLQNPLDKSLKVLTDIKQVEMATSKQSACAALAFKIGDMTDVVTCEIVNVAFDALMSSNVSPLKKKLLESGLADDYFATTYEPVLEPALVVGMQGMKEVGSLPKFEEVLREALSDILEEGLDTDLIEASINHFEIVMREHNFGVADGVTFSLDLLSSWLYDEEKPFDNLCYEKVFEKVRNELQRGGFERVLRGLILENKDIAKVEIIAVDETSNEQPQGFGRDLSSGEVEEINEAVAKLNEIQTRPDDEADLAKLPYLTRSDVGQGFVRDNWQTHDLDGVKVISHSDLPTHGLNYYNLYFDTSHIDAELIPWMSLYSSFLGKFDTDDYSAEQINAEAKRWCGTLSFSNYVATNIIHDTNSLMLKCSTSCMEGNEAPVFDLVKSILHTTDFSDRQKIAQLVAQAKLGMEQSLINAGHIFAMRRAESHFSVAGAMQEILSGISFYQFLCDLCDNMDESIDIIQENLGAISKLCCTKDTLTFSHTCNFEDAQNLVNRLSLQNKGIEKKDISLKVEKKKREAFAIKSDVTYTALRNKMNKQKSQLPFCGEWSVIARALSYDYLWNTIRVQGGAYGCGFNTFLTGNCGFYTYRDPNVSSSIKTFEEAGLWLNNFSPSNQEFEGLIVSSLASLDEPKKAPARMKRGDLQYFTGINEDVREQLRHDVLVASREDLTQRADDVTEIAKSGSICTIGNKSILLDSGEFEEIVDL